MVSWIEDTVSESHQELETLTSNVTRALRDVVDLTGKLIGKPSSLPADLPDLPRELSFWIGAHLGGPVADHQQALLEITDTGERLQAGIRTSRPDPAPAGGTHGPEGHLLHPWRRLGRELTWRASFRAGLLLPLLLTGTALAVAVAGRCFGCAVPGAYLSTASVAAAYDRWTDDRLLERLWGEHVHLGHYGDPPGPRDFRAAKAAFVHELVRWSGLDQLPPGSRVLDVGCGIGGSARILARDYGLEVLGISISPAQIARARELTPPDLPGCRFAVMDALALDLPDGTASGGFDAVWSVEAGPHMPDKQRYADEMLRVLKPGGCLAVADWNRRDPEDGPMNRRERWVMRQLLDQWAHPEFASIRSLRNNLEPSPWNRGLAITTGGLDGPHPPLLGGFDPRGRAAPSCRAGPGGRSSGSGTSGNSDAPADALGLPQRSDAVRRVPRISAQRHRPSACSGGDRSLRQDAQSLLPRPPGW